MTTSFKNLKPGAILSEAQFYTVDKIVNGEVELVNDLGQSITVDSQYVEGCLTAADQFVSEQKMSRTELIQIFKNNSNIAMTVNYNKKVDVNDVTDEVITELSKAALTIEGIKKTVKKAIQKTIDGEERTMVGRHEGHEDEFGRMRFIDMKIHGTGDARKRLVDPRTLNWLIVKGIKYKVK